MSLDPEVTFLYFLYLLEVVLELRGFQRGFDQCRFLERFKECWAMRFYTINSSSYTILRSRSSRKIVILKTKPLTWVRQFWDTRTFTKTKNSVAQGPLYFNFFKIYIFYFLGYWWSIYFPSAAPYSWFAPWAPTWRPKWKCRSSWWW